MNQVAGHKHSVHNTEYSCIGGSGFNIGIGVGGIGVGGAVSVQSRENSKVVKSMEFHFRRLSDK